MKNLTKIFLFTILDMSPWKIRNAFRIFHRHTSNKNVNFLAQFCLESISNGISSNESREASLNGNVYDFSVDYYSIEI